jgi:hypothetical protein
MRCFYFGCWNQAGHFMHGPGSYAEKDAASYYGVHSVHLDGTLAPRKVREGTRTARQLVTRLVWQGMGETHEVRRRLQHDSEEYPQGQFLLHRLDSGFTAIQWWDRNQGDTRGACNSTILLEGEHEAPAMLAALAKHYPDVLNLVRAGIELSLVEVPK